SAHAEVEAIRDACHHIDTSNLQGMILLASGEPCAMCYLNALFAGITKVLFAVDRNEAAENGFDYRGAYNLLADFPAQWPLHSSKFARLLGTIHFGASQGNYMKELLLIRTQEVYLFG
nr:hypothetical protein [Gammaproteobacteria bacterium]